MSAEWGLLTQTLALLAALAPGAAGVRVSRKRVTRAPGGEPGLTHAVLARRSSGHHIIRCHSLTLHTSPPEQKESGSSARGLQSHLEGRHLHITHLGGTSRKLDQEHFLAWLTWCLRDTWSPRPPRHSHSRGHTPGTRSWSGHQGGWRHTPDTGHISDGLSGWCQGVTH